jgi:hypothetical protein
MSPQQIAFGVVLLTGRDIHAPSACCPAGEMCREEVRKVAPIGSPLVGAFDPFWEMWHRLMHLGLVAMDYDRILVVPWSERVLRARGWKVIPKMEETRQALACL